MNIKTQQQKLSLDSIKHHFDTHTFRKGFDYFMENKVIKCSADEDIIYGEVQGSQRNSYTQMIYIKESYISTLCSCPLAKNCKHIVAVLCSLAASQEREFQAEDVEILQAAHAIKAVEKVTAPIEPLDREVDLWLNSMVAEKEVEERQKYEILYFLKPASLDVRKMHIECCRAYKKKDGSYGQIAALQPFDEWSQPNYATEEDLTIMQLVKSVGKRHNTTEIKLSGRVGATLLEEVVKTGRAHFQRASDASR
jgi:hypothetical protein